MEDRGIHVNDLYSQVAQEVWKRDDWAWLSDLYVEEDGSISAIIASGGKLYRATTAIADGIATMGEWQEVQVLYEPRERALTIIRQKDGSYRWFAIAETAVLLRVGEIDSKELFDDFIANIEEFGYPTLCFYHDDRMEFGDADWLEREENCLLASGTFREHPLSEAMVDASGSWGISVGFTSTEEPELWKVAEGVTIPVHKRGILRELSVLPEHKAASWFTSISTEVTRMRPQVTEALITLFGDEEKAQAYIETVDATNREIEEQALITREEQETPEEEPTEESHEDVTETTEYLTQADLEAAMETVRESLPTVDLTPLEERLTNLINGMEAEFATLRERIETLEKPVEERMNELIEDMPSREGYRPREVKDDKPRTFESVAAATLSQLEH